LLFRTINFDLINKFKGFSFSFIFILCSQYNLGLFAFCWEGDYNNYRDSSKSDCCSEFVGCTWKNYLDYFVDLCNSKNTFL